MMKSTLIVSLILALGAPDVALGLFDLPSTLHDIRTTFKSIVRHRDRPRRSVMLRRDASPGKCQLRLIGPATNATSPASAASPHSISTSGGTPTSTKLSSSSTARGSFSSGTSASATPTPSPSGSSAPSSGYKLVQVHNGSSFFDNWTFWNYGDPTNGNVNYIDQGTAWNTGLISINSAGNAIMKVDTTSTVSGNRNSVRIHSEWSFNGGILVADIVHMPTGCATWPAFWTNGPDWPSNGEIDILEGVHNSRQNQVSLHTRSGCTMPSNSGSAGSSVNGLNCGVDPNTNTGCGILAYDSTTYGDPLNQNGGGMYTMMWDDSGIRVWLFKRNNIPSDLLNDAPQPQNWGQPMANFPSTYCNPYAFMKDHIAIFDTTLCGDWAGSSWQSSGCAASTGVSSCAAFVQQNGAAFNDAYWEVKGVKLYQE